MAFSIRTEALVHARPEEVWAVLLDLASHASWNPFLTSIENTTTPGAAPTLGDRLRVSFASGEVFRPIVTEMRDGRVFEWIGALGARWIFAGRHRFELVAEGESTRLVHSERFTGVLEPLLRWKLRAAEKAFCAMNDALEARVKKDHGKEARPLA